MTPASQWRLDVIAQGHRLTDKAMQETSDMNEAKALVHGVISRAMHNIEGPVSLRELDTDMSRALRKRYLRFRRPIPCTS